jgi:two-component system sensor histidine kinase/response regulator
MRCVASHGELRLCATISREVGPEVWSGAAADCYGFELVERIRQMPQRSTATILMLTSAGRRGDLELCKKLGVCAYLLKPIRQGELRDAIVRVMGGREEERAEVREPGILRGERGDFRETLRVLVAEDNPVNQRLISRLLEKRGHRVTLANNGREAVNAAEKGGVDLILMDVQMPEVDGFEATEKIRAREKSSGAHLPIVALTAHAMKGDRERCLARGMDDYLTKPIQPQELDAILERWTARVQVKA